MDSFDDDPEWFGRMLNGIGEAPDLDWNPLNDCVALDASMAGAPSHEKECTERGCTRKRTRSDSCSGVASKAIRERLRREKLNERFMELSAILEPGRPVKADKFALLGDAIKLLSQLKSESLDYKESNEKLLDEIKCLKAEKNELRQEKQVLKAEKEKIEQQLKTMNTPGFIPALPPMYQANFNKVPVIPSYGLVPMWQYLPQGAQDTSQDHELRPPAA